MSHLNLKDILRVGREIVDEVANFRDELVGGVPVAARVLRKKFQPEMVEKRFLGPGWICGAVVSGPL